MLTHIFITIGDSSAHMSIYYMTIWYWRMISHHNMKVALFILFDKMVQLVRLSITNKWSMISFFHRKGSYFHHRIHDSIQLHMQGVMTSKHEPCPFCIMAVLYWMPCYFGSRYNKRLMFSNNIKVMSKMNLHNSLGFVRRHFDLLYDFCYLLMFFHHIKNMGIIYFFKVDGNNDVGSFF